MRLRPRDLPIVAKSLIGPLLGGLVLCAALAQFAVSRAQILDAQQGYERAVALSQGVQTSVQDFTRAHGALFRAITWGSMGLNAKLLDTAYAAAADGVKQAVAQADKLAVVGMSPALLDDFRAKLRAYADIAGQTLDVIKADPAMASIVINEAQDRSVVTEEAGRKLMAAATAFSDQSRATSDETSRVGFLRTLTGVGVSLLLLLVTAVWGAVILLSRPIRALTQAMHALAAGELEIEIPDAERRDEIGGIAQALLVFRRNAEHEKELIAEREQQEATRTRRLASLDRAALLFRGQVAEVVAALEAAAGNMDHVATRLGDGARELDDQSAAAAGAAGRSAQDVQTVASAAEQLSASIREVSGQISKASGIAAQGVAETRRTSETMNGLHEAATRIGDVVNLIDQIAGQTNLLALNATIEAARAGDAGKGFAVVASEVKALATQTARATQDIAAQVKAVQSATAGAVETIFHIARTVGEIDEISAAIGTMLTQQSEATNEIARGAANAAASSDAASAAVGHVVEAAQVATTTSDAVQHAAQGLTGNVARLHRAVDGFLESVAAA